MSNQIRNEANKTLETLLSNLEIRFFNHPMPLNADDKEPCNPLLWHGDLEVLVSFERGRYYFYLLGELIADEVFHPVFARICKKDDDGGDSDGNVRIDVEVESLVSASSEERVVFLSLPLNKGEKTGFKIPQGSKVNILHMGKAR